MKNTHFDLPYHPLGESGYRANCTPARERDERRQRLDHIGFFVADAAAVDAWFEFLQGEGVSMRNAPRTHRDGARSFYCYDPDGTLVQIIYHPPVAAWEAAR